MLSIQYTVQKLEAQTKYPCVDPDKQSKSKYLKIMANPTVTVKFKRVVSKESYLPVAPGWYRGTEEVLVSLQNKSKLRGKTELQTAWCL